jgi:hypothetical protein
LACSCTLFFGASTGQPGKGAGGANGRTRSRAWLAAASSSAISPEPKAHAVISRSVLLLGIRGPGLIAPGSQGAGTFLPRAPGAVFSLMSFSIQRQLPRSICQLPKGRCAQRPEDACAGTFPVPRAERLHANAVSPRPPPTTTTPDLLREAARVGAWAGGPPGTGGGGADGRRRDRAWLAASSSAISPEPAN